MTVSIQELFIRFKGFLGREDVLLAGLIVAVSLASYSLGRLSRGSMLERENLQPAMGEQIQKSSEVSQPIESKDESSLSSVSEGGYVASKNGTKYHLPWCPGASQIKEENKILFTTKADAEKAGYEPAANCKGI